MNLIFTPQCANLKNTKYGQLKWCFFVCLFTCLFSFPQTNAFGTQATGVARSATVTTDANTTPREMEMVSLINSLRTDPVNFTSYVRAYRTKRLAKLNNNAQHPEIVKIDETIDLLYKLKPLPTLSIHYDLYHSQKAFAEYIQNTGSLNSYNDNQNRTPWARLKDNCGIEDGNYYYVTGRSSIADAVVNALVDFESQGNARRNNLLGANWKFISCNEIGWVGKYKHCWIQTFGSTNGPAIEAPLVVNNNTEPSTPVKNNPFIVLPSTPTSEPNISIQRPSTADNTQQKPTANPATAIFPTQEPELQRATSFTNADLTKLLTLPEVKTASKYQQLKNLIDTRIDADNKIKQIVQELEEAQLIPKQFSRR
ncbi:MAG: hypothetical protein IPI59_02395 [Sphingobacteriales bacterium]|jgi:hypothetical protein|nr:hypothetical protein [Sphingobacteriales bacterium]MBP9140713.1 hypothetical protein [Chitinophagales bacterium]MDA0197962.1 hypothetical protein [Bacteroidota bacterium]MBK6890534.1 hypothetical protein [Sphingobacteriales bacterium]MBK7526414.1 hypothetical protein [Sphingobacteriales bacterium]